MSLASDHFGLFGMEVHSLGLMRILGGALTPLVVDNFGYGPAFPRFGTAACVAVAVLAVFMPDTSRRGDVPAGKAALATG
jgi:hypothetical protein